MEDTTNSLTLESVDDALHSVMSISSSTASTTQSPITAAPRPSTPDLVSAALLNYYDLSIGGTTTALFDKVYHFAKQRTDSEYINIFLGVLKDIQECMQDGETYPFVFLCAPSGTGKSTFGLNICSSIPALYWLHTPQENTTAVQVCYRPFFAISLAIYNAIELDIRLVKQLEGAKFSLSSLGTTSLNILAGELKFSSVHLVVSMFRELFLLKAENEGKSWLQLQSLMGRVSKGDMTISEGKEALYQLISDHQLAFPLITFIDECSCVRKNHSEGPSDFDKERIVFIRSLLRLLRVIPVLTGTDARTSNFCVSLDYYSGSSGNYPIWCVLFNDTSSYIGTLLEENCDYLDSKFENCPPVLKVVNFVRTVYPYEIPWLVDLALGFLKSFVPDDRCSVETVMDLLLLHISMQFIYRKNLARNFTSGQIQYIFSHLWDGACGKVNKGTENCINGHIAYLLGPKNQAKIPYFTIRYSKKDAVGDDGEPEGDSYRGQTLLTLSSNLVDNRFGNLSIDWSADIEGSSDSREESEDSRSNSEDDAIISNREFVPKSMFTQFNDAPLSGMAMFGLNLSRRFSGTRPMMVPFVNEVSQDTITRLTSFDAVFRKYDKIPSATRESILQRRPSGAPLEFMYQTAIVIASRARGVSGCPFTVFLRALTLELGPTRDQLFKLPKLVITGSHTFDTKFIPILAPMSVPQWPDSVTSMFEGGRFGVFLTPSPNYPVDSVIVETNLADDGNVSTPQTTGKKEYGIRENITLSAPKTLVTKKVLICECKQLNHPMTLGDIHCKVIKRKFQQFTDCNLFLVLTLEHVDFSDPKMYRRSTLRKINDAGFYMWYLDTTAKSTAFALKAFPNQADLCPNTRKDVIVFALKTVWGEQVLRSVRAKWTYSETEDALEEGEESGSGGEDSKDDDDDDGRKRSTLQMLKRMRMVGAKSV